MIFTVQYEVEIDADAWAHEYGSERHEVASQIESDLRDWMVQIFEEPKWDGLATGPQPHRVKVTRVEEFDFDGP